jgi:tyrosinase
MSRRQIMALAALAAAGTSTAGLLSACTPEQQAAIANRPIRRNMATLSASDPIITDYAKAIKAMQDLDTTNSTDPRSWNNQALLHYHHCRHQSWLVLPWHRAYLYYFEQICKEFSGNEAFALPYWNWTLHPTIPDVFFSVLNHSPRVAPPGMTIPAVYVAPTVIEGILLEDNFLMFAGDAVALNATGGTGHNGPGGGPLETGPHDNIHGLIGGDMGNYMSPRDPIFWTHHGRMDELWMEWNIFRDNPNTNDPNWVNTEFTEFCDRKGNPVTVKVIATILYPYFSYRYDTQVTP